MSDGFHVVPETLDGIADALDAVSGGLEGLAGSVPAVPEAGAVTGDIAAALGHLLDQAGELSVVAAAAADGVRRSLDTYVTTDREIGTSLDRSGTALPGRR